MMLNVIECDLISSMVYEKNFVNVNEKEIKRNNSFKNVGNVREIPEFPSYYVSDEGKVYSTKKGKTRELKGTKDKDGYLIVGLYDRDGKVYFKKIHRLVLSTFKPISDMSSYQVNHRDEQVTNNKLENLEWCTAKYNTNYGTRNERAGKAISANKERAKAISKALSKKVLQYDQEYNLIATYSSATEAGKAFGINSGTISYYCNSLKLFRKQYYFQYANS